MVNGVQYVCIQCGETFTLGVSGILLPDGSGACDKCARVERAANGFVLLEDHFRREDKYKEKVCQP